MYTTRVRTILVMLIVNRLNWLYLWCDVEKFAMKVMWGNVFSCGWEKEFCVFSATRAK